MSPYIYIYIYHHIWLANLPCTSAGLEEAANDMRRRVQVAMALDLRLGPWLVVGPCSFWHHPDDHPDDLMGLNWGLRIAAPYAKVLGNHFNPEDFLSVSESALSLSGVGLGLMANSQLAGSFKNWHSRTWGHRKVWFIDGTPDLSRWKCEDSNGTTPPKVRESHVFFSRFQESDDGQKWQENPILKGKDHLSVPVDIWLNQSMDDSAFFWRTPTCLTRQRHLNSSWPTATL